jgi:hypothetical protein
VWVGEAAQRYTQKQTLLTDSTQPLLEKLNDDHARRAQLPPQHDWDDARCRQLLARLYDLLPSGGCAVVCV